MTSTYSTREAVFIDRVLDPIRSRNPTIASGDGTRNHDTRR